MKFKKVKSGLAYYIFALLVAILILILWNGFQRKSQPAIVLKKNPFEAPKIIGEPDDLTQKIFFASNGKDTVYKIKKGDKWAVIFRGTEGEAYDFVSNPIFSPDGTQLAYNAELGNQAYVVVNNTLQIMAYQRAGFAVFSPDGTLIAFVASQNSSSYVIIVASTVSSSTLTTISGTESQSYEQIGTATNSSGDTVSIVFSPDGQQIAYIVEKDDGLCVVINGEESAVYDSIFDLALNDDGTISYTAETGDQTVTVVDSVTVSTEDSPPPTSSDPPTSSTPPPTPTSTDYSDYKYKISTDKDIDRSSSDSVDVSTDCPDGQDCNF